MSRGSPGAGGHLQRSSLALLLLLSSACPTPQTATLSLIGTLEREGIAGSDDTAVDVDFESDGARAEWWPCDLRVTASGCVDGSHVNVYLTLPNARSLDELGANSCTTDDGTVGAYEILREKADAGDDVLLGTDLAAFVLVASDLNDDGSADLDDDDETRAASLVLDGELVIRTIGSPSDALAFDLEGSSTGENDVTLAFDGEGAAVTSVPPLDVPRSCVSTTK